MTMTSQFWAAARAVTPTAAGERMAAALIGGAGCCFRCVLRFMGVRAVDAHESVASSSSSSPCPACLGLLQLDLDGIARSAFQTYQQRPYILERQVFGISLRLPPTLPIRQRSLGLFLAHELGMEPPPPSTEYPTKTNAKKPVVADDPSSTKEKLPKVSEIKDVFKHLMIRAYERASGATYDSNSNLVLALHLDHPETDTEFTFMTKIPHAKFDIKKARQRGCVVYLGASTDKITQAASHLSYQDLVEHNMLPPPPIKTMAKVVSTQYEHSQIYIAGRYCKLQRGISNSPWHIGEKRLAELSVEELIGNHFDKYFSVSTHKFSSSGREDVDVLMLGKGRPFYFELVNPRRTIATETEMHQLEKEINLAAKDKVSVRDLQIVTRENTSIMKDSVSTKSKSYRCLVEFSTPVPVSKLDELALIKNLALQQQNPTRVPRRADIMREKCVESMSFTVRGMKPMNDVVVNGDGDASTATVDATATTDTGDCVDQVMGVKTVDVFLRTSAGTYVKEFVHGDNGRTQPCLASLVGVSEARVIELDVLEIHVDWPIECHRTTSVE